jgi:branched-chain amino acid transport system substrate-binding protein
MKIKTLLAIFAVIIIFAGLLIWNHKIATGVHASTQVLQIGCLIPLTGGDAFWGKNIQNGVELAREEINQAGGILGKQIQIVYEDSRSDPRTGTAAVNKLITANHVQCIIGDTISSVILAVAPIVEKQKVVLLGFGESAEITKAGDYIFRNWNSAASDAEITGEFAATKAKRFVVLNQNDAFGKSAKALFVDQLKKVGAQVVFEDEFDKEQTDFKTLLSRFKSLDYDGLYAACFHPEALLLLRQYAELNMKNVPIFGVSSWEEGTFIDFAKKNFPNRVYYGYPKPPDPNSKVVQHFRQAYEKKYGKPPEILCDNGYDALMMFKVAINDAGVYNGEKIKDELYKLNSFEGSSGVMAFDSNGDVHKPFGLKVITQNGADWYDRK